VAAILASCGGPSAAPTSSQPARANPSASALATAQQRALVIAGGGPLGRAWEIGLLKGLKDSGIDLTEADLIIGTSIGGILGTQVRAGKSLDSLYNASTAPASNAA